MAANSESRINRVLSGGMERGGTYGVKRPWKNIMLAAAKQLKRASRKRRVCVAVANSRRASCCAATIRTFMHLTLPHTVLHAPHAHIAQHAAFFISRTRFRLLRIFCNALHIWTHNAYGANVAGMVKHIERVGR